MAGYIDHVQSTINKFIGKIIGFESGDFHLHRGHHEFFMELKIIPEKVWISTDEPNCDGCGIVPVNKVSCRCVPDGLYFKIEIETDECKVNWFATI